MAYTQKHTIDFAAGQKGWTESLYIQPQVQTVAAGLAILQQLCVARAQMLGQQAYIKAYRAQVVEAVDGSKVKFQGDTVQRTLFPGSTGEPCAQADLSLLVDCVNATVTKHKQIYLGGIWDSISQNFGAYVPNPTFETAFTNWTSKIVQFGYGWPSRTPSIKFVLSNYVMDADGYVTITCAGLPFNAITQTTPFKVGISSLPSIGGRSVLNGDIMVTKIDASTCKTAKPIAVTPFTSFGYLVTYTTNFQAIAVTGIEKVVSRERGAPLLESPGRRKARPRT